MKMINKKQFYLIMLSLFIATLPDISYSKKFYDWEDINKTMSGLELIFKNHQNDKLIFLSDDSFKNSLSYNKILNYILNYSINLGYTNEKCVKEFSVIKGKFINHNLMIVFIKKKNQYDGLWCVIDAYLEKGTNKIKKIFQPKGLNHLAIEYNFSDFISLLRKKKIKTLNGIAPFGKLPLSFFEDNTISKTENTTLFVTNVIIYENSNIKDIIYIKLNYYPKVINDKRGWLITESESMIYYYQKYEKENSDISLLTNNMNQLRWSESINNRNYNLSKKSKYFYAITSLQDIIKNKETFITIKNILVPTFSSNRIVLSLLLDDTSIMNNTNISSFIKDNQLINEFNGFICVSKQLNHTYLNVKSSNNNLLITTKINAPFRLSQFIVNKTVFKKEQNRFYIELIKDF
ncbi:hypothetical protein MHK_005614 [Candidatus Magnetomorum sp. HK-1]|nr:hypothetical protein MHK_005614 [Candidatus Magnetomorum sp. HK-1]